MDLNAFGRKIYQTLGYLIPYAVSIAMLPFFFVLIDWHKKELNGKRAMHFIPYGVLFLAVFLINRNMPDLADPVQYAPGLQWQVFLSLP